MNRNHSTAKYLYLSLVIAVLSLLLAACGLTAKGNRTSSPDKKGGEGPDTSRYLVAIEDEPDTVDFQCTTLHYTVALNAFNRLVEMKKESEGDIEIVPALAESWEVSEDGKTYTFHLRKDVTFSNGADLTASDVLYTFTRLLTHPDSCNQDIVEEISGADQLRAGETDRLEGFTVLDDYNFVITLKEPFAPFLSCIAMPAASILDEETTEAAGSRFGKDPDATVGTGSFVLTSWEPGEGMLLAANPDCWEGAPGCDGLNLRFLTESEEAIDMFEHGELDILDLDELGDSAEYFIHGDIYQNRLHSVLQLGITYIALNESVKPLNDVRVRKALQQALDRQALLDIVYSGRGHVENGIYPDGLMGYNPNLPGISYDPDAAAALLKEAGYPNGFDMTAYVKASDTQWGLALMNDAVAMWRKAGIRVKLDVIPEDEFMALRKDGRLSCYAATWIADYDDPDNFIYTFFGNSRNSRFRSLCYPRQDVMDKVNDARKITDETERMEEYRRLEKTIAQDHAAWIPLFSRQRYYVVSDRLGDFQTAWNGSVKNVYKYMTIR